MENNNNVLEIRGLNSYFFTEKGVAPAVDGLDLDIPKGKIIGLVGESGCGKSTIFRMINGLLPPKAGTISVNGKPITAREHYCGYMPQKDMLFPWRTIGENLALPLEIQRRYTKAQQRDMIDAALADVGLDGCRDKRPDELSGGMRQRVVIAIALACNPKILLCDEPTTALDVTIQAKILELIRSIQKERGISVIYITHDLGVVAKVADYVDVMYAGKIVETGTIDEIFYEPRHPYTWGLLSAMPDLDTADDRLYTIPGSPPNLLHEKAGDAFAPRNKYALEIDDEIDPPMFKISDTHFAATWLLDPRAPKVDMPPELAQRIARMKAEAKKIEEAE